MHCGSIDDVLHPYERIHRQRNRSSPGLDHRPSPRQLGQKQKKQKKQKEEEEEKAKAKAKEKQIMVLQQQRCSPPEAVSDGNGVWRKVSQRGNDEAEHMASFSRKLGLVEILMGYHSLLQATPASLGSSRRKEIYPTIGFSQALPFGG